MTRYRVTVLSFALILWCALFPGTTTAQDSIIEQMLQAQDSLVLIQALNVDTYASSPMGPAIDPQTGRLVVLRNVGQAQYQRQGAGAIVHRSGLIVTNAHIVNRANKIEVVMSDDTRLNAKVVRLVNNIDLALLKVQTPHPLTPLPIADSNDIQLGDDIITIGSSEFLRQTITGGKVTGLGRSRTLSQNGVTRNDLIQTSINLYQGDSGGPLFDKEGRLLGLMTAKEQGADHSSFAIPANQIVLHLINYLKEIKK